MTCTTACLTRACGPRCQCLEFHHARYRFLAAGGVVILRRRVTVGMIVLALPLLVWALVSVDLAALPLPALPQRAKPAAYADLGVWWMPTWSAQHGELYEACIALSDGNHCALQGGGGMVLSLRSGQ